MLAIFDNLGFPELMIVVIVAVLIFGKRLPEVAAQAGAQIGKFRRSLQDIKNDTGIDEDIRKIQRDIQNAVPRDLSMGEMARIASAELEKRMRANDEPKVSTTGADAIQAAAAESRAVSAEGTGVPGAPSPSAAPLAKEPTPASDASRTNLPPSAASGTNAPAAEVSKPSAPAIAAAHETGAQIPRQD